MSKRVLILASYGPDVLLGGHPVEWLAQCSWDFTLGGVREWEVIWEGLWEESAMLMRICGGVLRGTLLKTGPADFLRGLKWNRHTSFHIIDMFACMIFHFLTWNVSQLSCRSTWCTASILTWDWMVHPRFQSGGTWWLTSRAGEFSVARQQGLKRRRTRL